MATADGAWCRGESILAEQDGSDMAVAAFAAQRGMERRTQVTAGRWAKVPVMLALIGYLCACQPDAVGSSTVWRFSFRKGEKLTYKISYHTLAHAGSSAGASQDLEGQAVLNVRSVRGDGTAVIELVTSGKGRIAMRGQTLETESAPPSHIVAFVKPDGSVSELRGLSGKQSALLRPGLGLLNAGDQGQVFVLGTYTLFGLQLPDKLPPPGGKWIAHQKQEHNRSPELDPRRAELEPTPVEFTFVGRREYHGRACLEFSANTRFTGIPGGLPTTFYFDNAKGQLAGMELHVAKFGPEQVDVDRSAVLVKVE